jgi:hypothetical protein
LLDGQPIMTKGILDQELERFVTYAKNNSYVSSEESMVQHSDFETLERLLKNAMAFGKLRQNETEIT